MIRPMSPRESVTATWSVAFGGIETSDSRSSTQFADRRQEVEVRGVRDAAVRREVGVADDDQARSSFDGASPSRTRALDRHRERDGPGDVLVVLLDLRLEVGEVGLAPAVGRGLDEDRGRDARRRLRRPRRRSG